MVEHVTPWGKHSPSASFKRLYRLGLALVATLVLLNQVLVQPPLLRLLTEAPLINVSGRQRMLSQRLAKAALALVAATNQTEKEQRLEELRTVLALWTAAHESLRSGESTRAGLDARDPIVAAFNELDGPRLRMQSAASALIAGGGDNAAPADIKAILQAESEYLPIMDRIVGLIERETRQDVDRLIWTGWGVTGLVLVCMAGIGWFVLRPSIAIIERQLDQLRAARDELDERVKDRTRALERANEDLKREAEARSNAEDRQRSMLEQFSHVARTTTVGEMASGLAHELNQPLGAIANYAEGCVVALETPSPNLAEIRAVLGKITATTLRAGSIVTRIRRFVTRHDVIREPIDPRRLICDVEEFFRDEAARRGVTLQLELAPELPYVSGDPVQIQQVLVNLVSNSLDALSAAQTVHPKIVITTRQVHAGDLEFMVHDTGEGISEGQIAQVFDAFFSTRDAGMGMGLAISRTIIEAHQGRIHVDSKPGGPTTFRFNLPVASGDHAESDGLHR